MTESEPIKGHPVSHWLAIALKGAIAILLSFLTYPIPGGHVINGFPLPLIAWEKSQESLHSIPFPLRPEFLIPFFVLNIWFWFVVISLMMRLCHNSFGRR